MKILIVEDVTLVAKRIEFLSQRYLKWSRCDLVFDLNTAKRNIQHEDYDLVFLDINLNGANGFDLLNAGVIDPRNIIVVTAHADKAVKAFELAIFDFISKPIKEDRFAKVAKRFIETNYDAIYSIDINSGHLHYKISVSSIVYLRASGNYTEIYTQDGKMHLSEKGIGVFETELLGFMRCHRSYLTKPDNIESMQKLGAGQYRLNLKNKAQIPMSRSCYEQNYKTHRCK